MASDTTAGYAASTVAAVRDAKPLVHCVTNLVSMDIAANALLAFHASPAMVHAPEEAGGFAAIAGAVVINVGTIDELWLRGMRAAFKSACAAGVPVVLDPVACGVPGLEMRTDFCRELCCGHCGLPPPAVIRCNASEAAALAAACKSETEASAALAARVAAWAAESFAFGDHDGPTAAKGADSTAQWYQALPQAVALAAQTGSVVAVTGAVDVVVSVDGSSGCRVGLCENGHELLTRITAAGCALSAVCGAAVAAQKGSPFDAVLGALSAYGSAGEAGAESCGAALGPGSLRAALIDQLWLSGPDEAGRRERVTVRDFALA